MTDIVVQRHYIVSVGSYDLVRIEQQRGRRFIHTLFTACTRQVDQTAHRDVLFLGTLFLAVDNNELVWVTDEAVQRLELRVLDSVNYTAREVHTYVGQEQLP